MPAQYDPNIIKPWRKAAYMATELGYFGLLHAIKHRFTTSGHENIPDGPFVVVGNHISNDDPPMLALTVRKPVIFIAKQELYENPLMRSLLLFYGAISVNRSRPEPSTFKAVKEVCKHGWCLGMFIEGTRTKTPGILGQPHEGPAYFARILKFPIVPVGIVGTDKTFGKAHARIGKPMPYGQDIEATTWQIMEALSELTGFALPPKTEKPSNSLV